MNNLENKQEVLNILKKYIPNWKIFSAKDLEAKILIYLKNKSNPAEIHQIMHEIVMDDNAIVFKK
jgi:hypothetical protein